MWWCTRSCEEKMLTGPLVVCYGIAEMIDRVGDDWEVRVRQRSEYRGGASEGVKSSLLLVRQRVAWIAACMMSAMLVLRALRTARVVESVGPTFWYVLCPTTGSSTAACGTSAAAEEEAAVAVVSEDSGGTGTDIENSGEGRAGATGVSDELDAVDGVFERS